MNVSVSGTTSRSFCLCLSLCLSRLPTLHLSKKSIFKKITRSWKEPGFLPIWLWDCHPAVQSGWRMQRGPDERHATHSNASQQGHERSAHAIHKVLVRDFPIAPLTVVATAYSLTSALQGPECSTVTLILPSCPTNSHYADVGQKCQEFSQAFHVNQHLFYYLPFQLSMMS